MADSNELDEVNLSFAGRETQADENVEKDTSSCQRRKISLLSLKWLQLLIVETFYSAEEAGL